jgi:hypothetical protein
MKAIYRLLIWCVLAVVAISCEDDDAMVMPDDVFFYDFEQDAQGWEGGIADFPKNWDQSRFEFEFTHDRLPADVDEEWKAMRISGRNISDDLFMFMKKQLTGLRPHHTYRVTFQIELASQYPEKSVGIGGSPGASVYLKAGGSATEPMAVEVGDYIRMNIDKGNQAQGGEDMQVLGTIGITGEEFRYQLIQRDNLQNPIEITTDSKGSMWIIIGTDSGFEGTTTLYYNSVEVELRE